jgi:hypothetical protein
VVDNQFLIKICNLDIVHVLNGCVLS